VCIGGLRRWFGPHTKHVGGCGRAEPGNAPVALEFSGEMTEIPLK
jgi:hypothetical protein